MIYLCGMNKLIEIITAYLGSVTTYTNSLDRIKFERACVNGAKEFLIEEATALSEKIKSSGLIGPQIQDVIFGIYPDGYRDHFWFTGVQNAILQTKDKSKLSDGYHSFEDLYSIRLAYNVALFNEWGRQGNRSDKSGRMYLSIPVPKHDVHKSQRHHDGELCFGGGWFIVVANLPSGQISNHYEMKHWDLFRVPAVEKAKYEWDGHTSEDVIKRLIA